MADVKTVSPSANIELRKNTNVVIYLQRFKPDPTNITEHVSQTLVVTFNTSQVLNLGTISTVRNIMLQTDKAVSLNFNGGADNVNLTAGGTILLAACALTAITVKNLSVDPLDDATINYVLTD